MGSVIVFIIGFLPWSALLPLDTIDHGLVEERTIGSFEHATRIVVSTTGSLFIVDAARHSISSLDDINKPQKLFGGYGWTSGSFDTPTGITSDGINIYVADYGNHRIQRFDRNLSYISSLSTRDTSDASSRFGYPLDVGLSEFGDLFILDGENKRVVMFDARGNFQRSFGTIVTGGGTLREPFKLLVGKNRIYVGEPDRIRVFDYFGHYIQDIGQAIVSQLVGITLQEEKILAASKDSLWWFSSSGEKLESFSIHHLISSEPIRDVQDICFGDMKLYILTPHTVLVFKYTE
jgi:hypothetical protein